MNNKKRKTNIGKGLYYDEMHKGMRQKKRVYFGENQENERNRGNGSQFEKLWKSKEKLEK